MNNYRSVKQLQSLIKEEAKKVVRSVDNTHTHMQILDSLARQNGFSSYHELEKLVSKSTIKPVFNDVSIFLEPPPRSNIIYRLKIGDSAWSLRAENNGPTLHLEYRPPCKFMDESNRSNIGLFQTIQRAENLVLRNHGLPQDGWVVARYGSYRSHTLDFMTEDEVRTLSYHFGIPYCNEIKGRDQQIVSEQCFLQSPAFKNLRIALRSGTIPLPRFDDWCYGLSPIWAHLVASSDENFAQASHIVDRFFSSKQSFSQRMDIEKRLAKVWEKVPTLKGTEEGLDYGFSI